MRYHFPDECPSNLEEERPGRGTYIWHGYTFSLLAGYLRKSSKKGTLSFTSVLRETEYQLLPDVGPVVTYKVSSIISYPAKACILYVGSTPLKNSSQGTIHKEEVQATEKAGWNL